MARGLTLKNYDFVFFLLGDKYLQALELPLEADNNKRLLFFASKTSKKLIPKEHPYYFIEIGQAEAKSFSYGLVGLKGYLFKLLTQEVVKEGKEVFERIAKEPGLLMDLLDKYVSHHPARDLSRQQPYPTSSSFWALTLLGI